MTLILSLATNEYILQVSDRQLSYPDGRVVDGNRNKVVVWPPNFVFGFTGLGYIAAQPTDIWLHKTLCDIRHAAGVASVNQVFEELALRAGRAFRAIRTERRHHCFVAIGWATRANRSVYSPVMITVSNALDEDGRWLAVPRDDFAVRARFLQPSDKYLLEIAGQDIHVQGKRLIRRRMSRPTSALAASKVLLTVLRVEASRSKFVGARALIVNVPRTVLGQSRLFFLCAPPSDQNASMLYVGVDGEEDQYGPAFVDGPLGYHYSPLPDDYVPPPRRPWSAIILTDRRLIKNLLGEDSWSMGVAQDYHGKNREWSDLTGARAAPTGYDYPHPYYGLLVGLHIRRPGDTVLEDISRDVRHLVVVSGAGDETDVPTIEWLGSLGEWLQSHGMPVPACETFCSAVRSVPKGQLVDALNRLLSTPVPHLDRPAQRRSGALTPDA